VKTGKINEEERAMTQSNLLDGAAPDRKLTKDELVQEIRLNVAAEHKAIRHYLVQAASSDHALVRAVLTDITNEKYVHIGELERLLELLTGQEESGILQGREKVDEMAAQLALASGPDQKSALDPDWKEKMQSLKQLGI
jgi:rubrerythrin